MFLALAFAAWGSVEASPLWWLASLVILGGAGFAIPAAPRGRWTLIGLAVCTLAGWLVATNLWANPSYSAAAPYHAAFLAGGFFLGRRAGEEGAGLVFGSGLAFTVCLSLWAIAQQVGGEARSHALFETPATLAVCINLVLAPGLVLLAARRIGWLAALALVVLVAALAATASRGGWLALGAGAILAGSLALLERARLEARGAGLVLAVTLAGCVLYGSGIALRDWGDGRTVGPAYSPIAGAEAARSSHDRIALYRLAYQAITPASLLLGSGYLASYYLIEAADPPIRSADDAAMHFVHNDYLQVLLELGVLGLGAVLLLVALPVAKAWRTRRDLARRSIAIALAAATTTMAVHALVDFPFYIPICLLMYGIALGLSESIGDRQDAPSEMPVLGRALVAAAATLAGWVLLKPAVAEASALRANQQWRTMHAEDSAYWFEFARRVEARDWRYHWYVGQFWLAQALAGRTAVAAQRADAAFAAGFAANPREVRNLLGRLATQRRVHELLPVPADDATLRGWAELATQLAPHDPAARAELAALAGPGVGRK